MHPDVKYIATRIADSLEILSGERILVRRDQLVLPELARALVDELVQRQAVVTLVSYEPQSDFEQLLNTSDVCIRLPLRPFARYDSAQENALHHWLDKKLGREVHFHGTTVGFDDWPVDLEPAKHMVQYAALDIDYDELNRRLRVADSLLRRGTIRVTTPAGTAMSFRVGDRPANLQDGDASRKRMQQAIVRVDRQIELPAGVLRIAPIEESVSGRLVYDEARFGEFGEITARSIEVTVRNGRVASIAAKEGVSAVRKKLQGSGFREFALGFNPKLIVQPRTSWLPYYGYGAGTVRLSFGDNSELGGAVAEGPTQRFFFAEADVTIEEPSGCKIGLVARGKLNVHVLDTPSTADCRSGAERESRVPDQLRGRPSD